MHDWIKDYLTDRQQFTVNGNVRSTTQNIKYGVPQGSVLGPLLFLLYVNDISNACDATPRLFADDTNVFIFDKNIMALEEKCNVIVHQISNWMIANKLSLNGDKTCYQLFGPHPRDKLMDISIKVNNIALKRNATVKYLGILIDEDLSWQKHIRHVYETIVKFTGIFFSKYV